MVRVRGVVAVRGSRALHNGVRRARRRVVHPAARPAPRVLRLVARVPVVLKPLVASNIPYNITYEDNLIRKRDETHTLIFLSGTEEARLIQSSYDINLA